MSNVISSAIFCARNVDKAERQDKVGRWAVAVGQGKKVFDYVRTLDNDLGKGANEAYKNITMVSEKSKALQGLGKAVDFASKKVNPLICVSSGIDILRAKDKEEAFVENGAALGGMFATEKLMKDHLDDVVKIKGIDTIAQKVMKYSTKNKYTKAIPSIIHGTAFVIGSCTGYSIGQKFGKLLLNETGYYPNQQA
ncbi:MAG: hypothetical protein PHE78_08315 [Candidatus Gastranaerophilales bacterium]|nr:hypothetical protein [Candidatus Gastranaerophilales bacterium]